MSVGHSAGARPAGRRYSMAEHGASQAANDFGHRILRPAYAARYMCEKPAYKQGQTIIRVFPGKEPDGSMTPYRVGAGPLQYGDWVRRYDMMAGVGVQQPLTYITHDRADDSGDPRGRASLHPAAKLRSTVEMAIRMRQEEQGWAALVQEDPQHEKSPALPKPTEMGLVFCACFHRGTKTYNPPQGGVPNQRGLIMTLPKGATNEMFAEFDKLKEGYTGDPSNYAEAMLHGDPISPNYGKFISFFAKKNDPRNQQQQTFGFGQPQTGRKEREEAGYSCMILPQLGSFPPQLNAPHLLEMINRLVLPWDEILWFPTYQEQAQMLAHQFPPNLVCRAWADNPEWIPDEIRMRTTHSPHFSAVGPAPAGFAGPWGNGQPGAALPGAAPGYGAGMPIESAYGYSAPAGAPMPYGPAPQPEEAPWGGAIPWQPGNPTPGAAPMPYADPAAAYGPAQAAVGQPAPVMPAPLPNAPQSPYVNPGAAVGGALGWGAPAPAGQSPQVDETLAGRSLPPTAGHTALQAAPVAYGPPPGYPTGQPIGQPPAAPTAAPPVHPQYVVANPAAAVAMPPAAAATQTPPGQTGNPALDTMFTSARQAVAPRQ